MCGITGYFGEGNANELEKMTNKLIHRGPDDFGIYTEDGIGLGHRRLSIIDLSQSGSQPMKNSDGSLVLVFNGEIYNFLELREEGQKEGYGFKSSSDTEVILYLYERYGLGCFEKMNGMFAVAIYDKKENKLILARDRLGKKPLYWGKFGDTLVFGSELKSILEHHLSTREIDLLSLNKYLNFDYVPTPHSILKNIYKLEPGVILIYKNNEVKKEKFWQFKFDTSDLSDLNENEILELVDKKLGEAVSRRLISDVPLGVFLSGGLDSSTVAYYSQKSSKEKIKTFSIGFNEKDCDESAYARQVADYLGTDHYEQVVSAKDILDIFPKIGDMLDEPVSDYSLVPTYLLSKFTREKVTVSLSGDGGDELFFGYPTFQTEKLAGVCKNMPGFFYSMLNQLVYAIPNKHKNYNLSFKLDRFLKGCGAPLIYRHHYWMGTYNEKERGQLLNKENKNLIMADDLVFEDIKNYFNDVKNENKYNQLSYLYMRTYLMDQVMVKVDRMAMLNSLETRSPLLDYGFVDLINSIPIKFKLKNLQSKYLLKKLMDKKLPKNIVYRKKQGFGIPLSAWLGKELKPFVLDILSETRIKRDGIFNYTYVNNLLEEHFSKRRDNRKQILSLLMWHMWYDKWIK